MEGSTKLDHQEEMFALVAQWGNSGLSQKAFATQHNLSVSKFGYWVRKYRSHQGPPSEGFISLQPVLACSMFEIHYPNGVVLKTPTGLTFSDLSSLIKLG